MPVFLGGFAELPRPGEIIRILGSEAEHISAHKLKADTEILLTNDADKVVWAQLVHVGSCGVHARVITAEERPRPRPHVTVMQALPKPNRAELAVGLMTEAGVDEIIPWTAVNCVARWQDTVKVTKARAKWQSTVCRLAEQARHAWIPPVADLHSSVDTEQLIQEATSVGGVAAILHEEETVPFVKLIAQTVNAGKVLSIVGPREGVSPRELGASRAAGTSSVVPSPTVFRDILAGIAALCALGPLTKRWGDASTRGQ